MRVGIVSEVDMYDVEFCDKCQTYVCEGHNCENKKIVDEQSTNSCQSDSKD